MTAKKKPKDLTKLHYESVPEPIYYMHEYQLDVQNNHIYLFPTNALAGSDTYGDAEPGIEYTMANKFVMNTQLCMLSNPELPLLVHMKSCGGFWGEGMAIFDSMISYPMPTTIVNYSHARSMSSIILQSAAKRVMMPNSHFMFHDGTYGDWGTVKQVRSGLDFYDKTGEIMMDIYAHRMKERGKFKSWSISRIKDMMREHMDKKEDVFITAQEAIDWGLADEIFDGDWSKLTSYTDEQLVAWKTFTAKFLGQDVLKI